MKLHLTKQRYLFWLIFAAVMLIFFDRQTLAEFAEDEHIWWREIASSITDAANAWHWFAFSSVSMLASWLCLKLSGTAEMKGRLERIFYWSAHFFLALISTGCLVLLLKFLVGRERPEDIHGTFELWDYYSFSIDHQYQSFPSGHTQTIFVAATFFSLLLPRAGVLFFLTAVLIALTRLLVLKHFPSDLVIGAFIGVEGSLLSVKLWSRYLKINAKTKSA